MPPPPMQPAVLGHHEAPDPLFRDLPTDHNDILEAKDDVSISCADATLQNNKGEGLQTFLKDILQDEGMDNNNY